MAESPMWTDPYSVIRDRAASDAEWVSALALLQETSEPPTFWSEIANDPSYPAAHRRRAVFQLLRRHAHGGMTLGELARLLNGPSWLSRPQVRAVAHLHGKIPVSLGPDRSVFAIRPELPAGDNSAIYLGIAGHEIDEENLFSILKGRAGPRDEDPIVLEIGLSEPGEGAAPVTGGLS